MKSAEKIVAEIVLSQVQCPSPVLLMEVKRDAEQESLRRIDFVRHTKRHHHNSVGTAVDCLAYFLLGQVERRYHDLTRRRIYELICLRFRFPIKTKHWDDDWRGEYHKDEPAYDEPEDTGYRALLFDTLKLVVDQRKLYRCHTPEEVLRKADLFSNYMREEHRLEKQVSGKHIEIAKKGCEEYRRTVIPEKKKKSALKQLRIRKLHKPRSRR